MLLLPALLLLALLLLLQQQLPLLLLLLIILLLIIPPLLIILLPLLLLGALLFNRQTLNRLIGRIAGSANRLTVCKCRNKNSGYMNVGGRLWFGWRG